MICIVLSSTALSRMREFTAESERLFSTETESFLSLSVENENKKGTMVLIAARVLALR